jgi:hypothetical protein
MAFMPGNADVLQVENVQDEISYIYLTLPYLLVYKTYEVSAYHIQHFDPKEGSLRASC